MPQDMNERVSQAVRSFWATRTSQDAQQRAGAASTQGSRGAVVGGKQMDGFANFLVQLLTEAGVERSDIFIRPGELPGFFRPTKEWDLLVVKDRALLAAIELKSQVGSFGNNFNNRTEEALGSATDLWTAYRAGQFQTMPKPFLGYVFVLEDSAKSRSPVAVREPHFPVLAEFVGASYAKRYEAFCRKLVLEGCYTAASFLMTDPNAAWSVPNFTQPAADLTIGSFVEEMLRHTAPR